MDIDSVLRNAGIDPGLSRWVLERVREMDAAAAGGPAVLEIEGFPVPEADELTLPPAGSDSIANISAPELCRLEISRAELDGRLRTAGLPAPIIRELYAAAGIEGSTAPVPSQPAADEHIVLNRDQLYLCGLAALPLLSYGILNGGSATSYADGKKNRGFNSALFDLYREAFDRHAEECRGRAKGLTAAYINPDASAGFSFIELKMRAALLLTKEHYRQFPSSRSIHNDRPEAWPLPVFPLFQMTSSANDADIRSAYEEYRSSPALSTLARELDIDPTAMLTGIQPMIAALGRKPGNGDPEADGSVPRNFFLNAWGKDDSPLPLPGGHGQNFHALDSQYRELRKMGKRFAYLGNVDNLGFLPDPLELGILMLFGSPAGFDFSYKTAVDVKGGVLLRTPGGKFSCGDIGPAISRDEVERAEKSGTPILFNCATGLFDLEYLTTNLHRIQQSLPLRVSDQDKDAGKYSQAEQVTWEVMSLIDGFTAFGVDKFRRFLASKLLVENFLTSGLLLDSPDFPADLRDLAVQLHRGFSGIMTGEYGMALKDGRWQPEKR